VTGYRRVDGLKMQPVPDCVVGPMAARIRQVELLVDAAVEGNRSKALQALAQDPMILSLREAEELLSATIEAHGERLAHLK